METLIISGAQLTGEAQNAYSSGRGIFMPDGNGSQEVVSHQTVVDQPNHTETTSPKPNTEELRAKWLERFPEPDSRSTIEHLVEMGVAPDTVTSKGPVEQKTEVVLKTSMMSKEGRIKKAEELLHRKLSQEEIQDIEEAHYSGGNIFDLSPEELEKRVNILKRRFETPEERRILIEAGIVAPVDAAEAEAETLGKHFVFSVDPNLGPLVGSVNDFLVKAMSGAYNKRDHDLVTSAIRDLDPTATMSDADKATFESVRRRDFEMARAGLLADIVEKTGRFTGSRDREEVRAFKEHVTELTTLMREGNYDGIEAFFNDGQKSDMERSTYSESLATAIRQLEEEISEPDSDPEVVKRHEATIEFAMEYALERIINLGDISPKSEYPRFNLYQSDNIDRITQMARVYDERRVERHPDGNQGTEMFNYVVSLKVYRQAMHELFRGMKDEKTFLGLITGLLRKDGISFVEKQVAGVSDVQIVYEQQLGSALALKKQGWLTDQDLGRVDSSALGQLRKYKDLDFFRKTIKHSNGSSSTRAMRDWEISRAHLMGRSLSAASQRRLVYEVLGDVPRDSAISYKSVESEFIARRLALIKLIPERFFGQPESKRLLRLLEEELMRGESDELNGSKYGYESGGERRGLYGNSQKAFAFLDTGVVDPKSNSWRGNLMFLRQKGYEVNIGGEKKQLGEYLEEQFEASGKNEAVFNHNVGDVVSQQRLFLGILMRTGHLSEENKEIIWRNVAGFLPSRIAAFFPKETLEMMGRINDNETPEEIQARWIELRNKLFMAEMARVKNDAAVLKARNSDDPEIRGTAGAFKDLHEFYEMAELSPEEIRITQEITDFGVGHARDLARMTFPFAAFLDDVPETGWDELTDEDYDRILINDQSAFAEGYGQMVGLIAHPVRKNEEIIEMFHAAVEKIESPLGLETAQKKIEPFVTAVIRMRTSSAAAKWFGAAMKLARLPRSEMEKYNLQAQIAEDEEQTKDLLTALAQKDVISDNPNELDKKGRTQYFRMLDKLKANRKRQLYRLARILTLIIGPEFVKAFMGGGVLEDVEGLK